MESCTDEDVEAYKYAMSQNGPSGPLNYYRNMVEWSDEPRGFFNTKIKAPTLAVWVSTHEHTAVLSQSVTVSL